MDSIKNVLKKKCVGCGSCIGVCNQNALSKRYNKSTGFYDICFDKKKCNGCSLCRRVCPAILDNSSSLIGEFKKISLMYAEKDSLRKNATSGGVVVTIISSALNKGMVDKVYMIGESQDDNMQTKLFEIEKKDLLLINNNRIFASRYISYPVGEILSKIKKDKKYIIVGTPCQISSIRKANKDNIYLIGLACSGAASYNASRLSQKHLYDSFDSKVDHYYYRGNGWPGYNEVVSNDKSGRERHLESFFNTMFATKIFTRKGCRFCKDQLAENADISCFDYWNKKELSDEMGKTGVIVRNNVGEELIENAKDDLIVERDLSEKEVVDSQALPLFYKKLLSNNIPVILKLYYCLTDFIFKTKIYNFFSIGIYKRLTKIYIKIVSKNISTENKV